MGSSFCRTLHSLVQVVILSFQVSVLHVKSKACYKCKGKRRVSAPPGGHKFHNNAPAVRREGGFRFAAGAEAPPPRAAARTTRPHYRLSGGACVISRGQAHCSPLQIAIGVCIIAVGSDRDWQSQENDHDDIIELVLLLKALHDHHPVCPLVGWLRGSDIDGSSPCTCHCPLQVSAGCHVNLPSLLCTCLRILMAME